MKLRKHLAVFAAWTSAVSQMPAQPPPHIEVERPHTPIFFRTYQGTTVPPIELRNSGRMHSMLRAGRLYLTVQDAIALAIENNLDLEVDRYGPLAAEWQLRRQQAGGPLRGVTGGNSLINQVTSGQGVQGSLQAAGLTNNQGGSNNGGAGGAIISQIGPVTPNLDPVLQNTSLYSHVTTPQPNTVLSQTAALIDTHHIFNTLLQQGLLSGGYVQVTANESYLQQNAPTNLLNPSVAPVVQVLVRQNFLQGFGVGLNSRYIRVAEKNIGLAQETFRSQLLNLVVRTLNLYWDLVTDNDDLKARQRTLDIAQKFYDDTRQKISIGVVAKVEIYRAEGELQTRKRELAISQAAVRQQENSLKDAISRNGLE
ncbi:MAG: TolC family protein, partial [Bryobacteraceae bacterium]